MTKPPPHTETYVLTVRPNCDLCEARDVKAPASVDGKMTLAGGTWAYMCEAHFERFGVGLGLGKGQRLIIEVDQ